jgi:hypothetical protein
MLWLLQDGFRAKRLDELSNLLRLMTYDDDRLLCAKRRTRSDDLLDERASTRTVQNFRKTGLQPGAFSRCKNDHGQIVIGHKSSILALMPRI